MNDTAYYFKTGSTTMKDANLNLAQIYTMLSLLHGISSR